MLGKIIAGILGIFAGFVFVLLLKVRSTRKKINVELQKIGAHNLDSVQKSKIEQIILSKRKLYKKQNKGVVFRSVFGLNKKNAGVFPKAYFDIVKEVSVVFDNVRQRPYLDFSIKSGVIFLHKVVDRFESVIDATEIPILKNLNVSKVAGISSFTGKILSNKVVKKAMTFKARLLNVLKFLNPYHWVKKIALSYFFAQIINELLLASVDIVAWEFARFYEQGQSRIELKTA